MTKLGINIDHVATVRQARKETFPDPVEIAMAAIRAGANGITAHLREDRRHIQDDDIVRLKEKISVPLNMEMAASEKIVDMALRVKPQWACLVPEKREELTTEGGLDLIKNKKHIENTVRILQAQDIKVSLFIDPDLSTVDVAKEVRADAIELHTGTYARLWKKDNTPLKDILSAARKARALGLIVNAGHGIDFENVTPLVKGFEFNEFNIGFAIIARSFLVGIENAVQEMKQKIGMNTCAAS